MSLKNLLLLQNLYKLKSLGYNYTDFFNLNQQNIYQKPTTLKELEKTISKCHLCEYSKSRTQSMFGFGNENAEIFIVDYSVSNMQDTNNLYFTGRSSDILKNMIEKVLKVNINSIYFTHILKCKPLDYTKISTKDIETCQNYLFSQIEFIKPKIIIALGQDSYSNLVGDFENFENIRGHIIEYKGIKLIPIYHPQHLLRNPELKKVTLADLQTIKSCL